MRSQLYKVLNIFSSFFLRSSLKRLRVLAYHTVEDSVAFEKQLKFLKANFNLISIEDLQRYFDQAEDLPEKALLVTFDDGDISVLEKGLPLLKKYEVPGVLFVITELINTSRTFWCRRVEKARQQEGKTYAEAREEVNHLKRIPEKERRMRLKEIPEVQSMQLRSEDLRTFEANNVFIGNHTHTHPMIDKCTKAEVREELKNTRTRFEDWGLKDSYPVFAYPNGNWDPEAEDILRESGIQMAFLFDHKLNNRKVNPLRISRIRVDSFTPIGEFKVKISGMHSVLLNLKSF